MEFDRTRLAESPTRTGAGVGAVLGVVDRITASVGLPAWAFLIVGGTLVVFGERFWPDVGRTLVSLVVSFWAVLFVLRLIFGVHGSDPNRSPTGS